MNTKWEEEWRKIYDEWNNSPNAVGTIGTLAEAFIKDQITKAGKDSLRSLIPEIEQLIQKERFAGAPHALNEAIKLIQSRSEGENL